MPRRFARGAQAIMAIGAISAHKTVVKRHRCPVGRNMALATFVRGGRVIGWFALGQFIIVAANTGGGRVG